MASLKAIQNLRDGVGNPTFRIMYHCADRKQKNKLKKILIDIQDNLKSMSKIKNSKLVDLVGK